MRCPFCIKICAKCKRILVANKINFGKQKRGKYGLTSKCKKCCKQYYENNKTHFEEYRQEHKEKYKIYNKQYREEHKEEIKENKKQYYIDNKDEIVEYKKQYYEDNKREILEKHKKYKKNNPHIVFNGCIKRRQLKEEQGNGITKEQWIERMEFFEWKCSYSGIRLNKNNRSIDHIIPLDKNGENEIWNLVPMYMPYNSSKNNKDMIDWYIQQDFFDIDKLLKIYEWIEYAYKKWK